MAELIDLSDYTVCAGGVCRGTLCRKKVKVPPRTKDKRVLCRDCWHKMAEEAARNRYHWTHIAHRGKQHEMFFADDLELFIKQYEIELLE
jgi:hypothetical protein